jgi:hypothetical protein
METLVTGAVDDFTAGLSSAYGSFGGKSRRKYSAVIVARAILDRITRFDARLHSYVAIPADDGWLQRAERSGSGQGSFRVLGFFDLMRHQDFAGCSATI